VTALVVDTSALAAILFGEPSRAWLLDHLAEAELREIAAPTVVELGIVVEARLGPRGAVLADHLVREAEIDVVPCTASTASEALAGWRRFGKGRHPAGLNLGDCFTYALAVETGSVVLCTGEDFAATDVSVLRPPP
jgi:ribonuclease VapC